VADGGPRGELDGFLAFTDVALARTGERLPGTDRAAMALVLNLHRLTSSLVYDLESTVHRPAGWSWSAFRLLFTLWVAGGQEAGRAAELCGMSRAAVSSLANTLAAGELVRRTPAAGDRRTVHLSLTDAGVERLVAAFGTHNRRESEWAALLGAADLATLNTLPGRAPGGLDQPADLTARRLPPDRPWRRAPSASTVPDKCFNL
jgi:DNA-binding MarR family transcriptional regulator